MTVRSLFAGAVAAVLLLVGCTAPDTQPELGSEETFDGLRRVTNAQASAAWLRPGTDFSRYTKISLEGAGIEFRQVANRGGSQREFALTPAQKDRLREVVRGVFLEELANSSRFQLVEEPGPDVLTVWGGLYDVVSFVPPERAGRSSVFISEVGAATLVLELRDSMSNTTLARALDRRAASRAGNQLQFSSSASNWAEVRRVARRWATMLRTRLDASDSWAVADS